MSATPTAGTATVNDMQAQADANFARQLALQMASEAIAAKTNALKTTHEANMAVVQNFK